MSWCRGNVGLALGLLKIQNIIAADRENDRIQEMVDEILQKSAIVTNEKMIVYVWKLISCRIFYF